MSELQVATQDPPQPPFSQETGERRESQELQPMEVYELAVAAVPKRKRHRRFKPKKKVSKPESKKKSLLQLGFRTMPQYMRKYWSRRDEVFSKFDEGVYLTPELWYGATPEKLASSISDFIKRSLPRAKTAVDGFCGSGNVSIQLAKHFDNVIAIDKDPIAIKCLQKNSDIYGVRDKIQTVMENFDTASLRYKADVVFVSPNWNVVDPKSSKSFNLNTGLPYPIAELKKSCESISNNIVMFLPRNSNLKQIADATKDDEKCRLSYIYLHGALKGLCVDWGPAFTPRQYKNFIAADGIFKKLTIPLEEGEGSQIINNNEIEDLMSIDKPTKDLVSCLMNLSVDSQIELNKPFLKKSAEEGLKENSINIIKPQGDYGIASPPKPRKRRQFIPGGLNNKSREFGFNGNRRDSPSLQRYSIINKSNPVLTGVGTVRRTASGATTKPGRKIAMNPSRMKLLEKGRKDKELGVDDTKDQAPIRTWGGPQQSSTNTIPLKKVRSIFQNKNANQDSDTYSSVPNPYALKNDSNTSARSRGSPLSFRKSAAPLGLKINRGVTNGRDRNGESSRMRMPSGLVNKDTTPQSTSQSVNNVFKRMARPFGKTGAPSESSRGEETRATNLNSRRRAEPVQSNIRIERRSGSLLSAPTSIQRSTVGRSPRPVSLVGRSPRPVSLRAKSPRPIPLSTISPRPTTPGRSSRLPATRSPRPPIIGNRRSGPQPLSSSATPTSAGRRESRGGSIAAAFSSSSRTGSVRTSLTGKSMATSDKPTLVTGFGRRTSSIQSLAEKPSPVTAFGRRTSSIPSSRENPISRTPTGSSRHNIPSSTPTGSSSRHSLSSAFAASRGRRISSLTPTRTSSSSSSAIGNLLNARPISRSSSRPTSSNGINPGVKRGYDALGTGDGKKNSSSSTDALTALLGIRKKSRQ